MLGFLTYPHSVLITAQRYGLDPVAWLTDVLRRIPQATNHTVTELLLWNWKPAKA
ncbi:MAG: transposase domain-containing protein [Pedosphaera sp.]|nr:transposase domain-containing protein [Pedosphaera sp.]